MDMYFNAFVPTFVTVILYMYENVMRCTPNELQNKQLYLIVITGSISFIIIIFVIFVDYKKGSAFWTRWAPTTYLILIQLSYLIMPWINLTYFLFAWYYGCFEEISGWNMNTWIVSYNTMLLCNFVDYYRNIQPQVMTQI